MNPTTFVTAMVQTKVASALEGLSKLFHQECKLAFVMWRPGMPECFIVIGDEPLADAAAVITKSLEPAAGREGS